jgi:DNA-binding NarL/FixJ family response regulator
MTNVLIVDDHPVVVEGLRKIFCESEGLFSCAIAFTVCECKKALKVFIPDIVMLDINLPDGNGLDLCKEIHDTLPLCKIIAISSFSERSYIQRMLENGAQGYLLKNSSEDEIRQAVNDVLNGKNHFSYEINDILDKTKKQEPVLVTRREHEVLQFIADGLTNQEIADKMFISPLTVDSHRKNLLLKLDAKNTAALVKKGITMGLIQ